MKIYLGQMENTARSKTLPLLLREHEMRIFLSNLENGGSQSYCLPILLREHESLPVGIGTGRAAEVCPAHPAKRERDGEDMKLYLSGMEGDTPAVLEGCRRTHGSKPFLWNLCSYYYIGKNPNTAELIRDNSESVMIDSGAFTFMGGKAHPNLNQYVDDYCKFIQEFDRPNVAGYFEMDLDKQIGYDKVREYRARIEDVTSKVIPVWHDSLGTKEFINLCSQSKSGIIGITGCHDEIRDGDYVRFLKTAHDHGCKLHCLGMTNKKLLDTVPFDTVDSASWALHTVFGKVGGRKKKINQDYARINRGEVFAESYREAMKMQRYYYEKWRKICRD